MRGYVLAKIGLLPNDPRFLSLSKAQLTFMYVWLKKLDDDQWTRFASFLPDAIARSIGTLWTWDDFAKHPDTNVVCSSCGGTQHRSFRSEAVDGGVVVKCVSCKADWPVQAVITRPSRIHMPLALMIAKAMSKGGVMAEIRNSLSPPASKDGRTNMSMSNTVAGAAMMDETWGSLRDFTEVAMQVEKEIADAMASVLDEGSS